MNRFRREFIMKASAVSAGAIISPNLLSSQQTIKAKTFPFCVFTKCLQFLDYSQMAETLVNIGFAGAELSVREDGHVLPVNVKTDLPKAIRILQKSGISVPMMVSDIVNPDSPLTESILGTASEMGVKFYRLGYLSYDPAKSVLENLAIHKKTIDKFEKLNRKFGIQGCYQNHSGAKIGGPVWDLYWLVNGCDPEFISVQYDIRHAVAEGGFSWPLGMKLLSPWIKTTAIKDFYWKEENGKWKISNVPLSKGMVDFDIYLKLYLALGISGPVTIHYEYDLGGAQSGSKNPTMSLQEIIYFMKNDLNWLKKKFNEHGILNSYA